MESGTSGGEEVVRGITLIIGAAGFVDDEQVAAFQRAFCEAELPFAEIYINTPFHGTIVALARVYQGLHDPLLDVTLHNQAALDLRR